MSHSQGPWHACCLDGSAHYVFGDNPDVVICTPHHNDPKLPDYEPLEAVVTIEERRANARLIASSPTLLDTLKQVRASLLLYHDKPHLTDELILMMNVELARCDRAITEATIGVEE
jgi:hypothetical protein